MIHLEVDVANAAELLATEAYDIGALLRWESSATEAGTYAEGGTIALDVGKTLYDVWDGAGVTGTWYRTRVSDAGGTTFSAYSVPRSPVTSLVSIAEVRALVKSAISDEDLEDVIDREESWLTGKIGTLTGERTDTFTPGIGDTPLYLSRQAPSVVLTDAGRTMAASEFLFTPSTGQIRRIWSPDLTGTPPWRQLYLGWQGTVTARYTPSDEAAVKRAIIELARLTVGETGMASETMGTYSYTRVTTSGVSAEPNRAGLVRGILLRRPAYSLRIHSAMEPS